MNSELIYWTFGGITIDVRMIVYGCYHHDYPVPDDIELTLGYYVRDRCKSALENMSPVPSQQPENSTPSRSSTSYQADELSPFMKFCYEVSYIEPTRWPTSPGELDFKRLCYEMGDVNTSYGNTQGCRL